MASTRSLDAIYTPSSVAEMMVSAVRNRGPRLIVDPAVGTGNLLAAARAKWPSAAAIGTDICEDVIAQLKASSLQVGVCDFLDEKERSSCRLLKEARGQADVILMNPPFSSRGGRGLNVNLSDGTNLRASLPLAFVLTATEYLEEGGELIAIVPSGVLDCTRDREAIQYLSANFALRVIADVPHGSFQGVAAATVVIGSQRSEAPWRIPGDGACAAEPLRTQLAALSVSGAVRIIRGTMPMNEAQRVVGPDGIALVHSTDLTNANDGGKLRRVSSWGRVVSQPAVLLARVGRPRIEHIVVYRGSFPIALSDCVIALAVETLDDAELLARGIRQNWRIFVALYGGSCAPYLRLAQVRNLLVEMGVEVEWANETPQVRLALSQEMNLGMTGQEGSLRVA
jgi:tRNA1(Val) A37 N6-methylase TrmN6